MDIYCTAFTFAPCLLELCSFSFSCTFYRKTLKNIVWRQPTYTRMAQRPPEVWSSVNEADTCCYWFYVVYRWSWSHCHQRCQLMAHAACYVCVASRSAMQRCPCITMAITCLLSAGCTSAACSGFCSQSLNRNHHPHMLWIHVPHYPDTLWFSVGLGFSLKSVVPERGFGPYRHLRVRQTSSLSAFPSEEGCLRRESD